jgi:anti-anti-sigma factor
LQLEKTVLDNGIKQISLTGRLDMKGTAEVEDQFTIHTATQRAGVLIDLSGVEFLASIGMRMLVANAKALRGRGGQMALYKPQPLIAEALRAAGIDELIAVYDDYDTACTDLLAAVKD